MGALSQADVDELTVLEQSLWRAETRFDPAHMERVLAADFIEFGRSGRVHARRDALAVQRQRLDATLKELAVHQIAEDVALVTYLSEARYARDRMGQPELTLGPSCRTVAAEISPGNPVPR